MPVDQRRAASFFKRVKMVTTLITKIDEVAHDAADEYATWRSGEQLHRGANANGNS